jgi:trimeric autotransporter adhesin
MGESSAYEADISILQQDIASAIANGATVNGVAVTPSNANTLTEIQGQLAQLAQAAPNAVGTSAAAAQAQGVLHTNEQLILGEVAGDANLQNALAANGVANDGTGAVDKGFQAVPAQAADDAAAITAATAGANLSDIGTVFNAVTNLSNGGLNAGNITQFDNDMKAIATGLQNFISGGGLAAAQANTAAEQALATADDITLSQAQALPGVHVQTMLDQIQDQITRFDGMYAANPNIAARSTNDNLLDIIDIVQGDPALAASAGNATGNPSHAGGFAEQPGYLAGTIQHYQLISGPPLSRAQIISTTRSRRRPMERCIWIQRASNPSFSKSRDINSSATPSTPRRAAYSAPDSTMSCLAAL